MSTSSIAAQLPRHRPVDVYHQGLDDEEPRAKHAYLHPKIVLRLSVEKYPKREMAGREGRNRLGPDVFKRARYFRTARYWVFHVYE